MINQFKNLNPINLLLLAGYTFFIRMAIFYKLPATPEILENFPTLLASIPLTSFSPATNIFFATIIVFVQALIFNRIVNSHGLLSKPSYLPALLYVTGASLFLPFLVLSPMLICNFLIIVIIDRFLKLAKTANAMGIMFDVGILIALGTLIYFPFIMFIVMLWLSLLMYRPFNWREWFSGIIGFLNVAVFVVVFYYWNDKLTAIADILEPLTNKFPTKIDIDYNDYLVLVPVLMIMILATIQLRDNFFRSFITTRKAFQMLFFMFMVSLLSFYTKPGVTVAHFLICVPAGAVLLAYYFSNAKKRWVYESLFAILVISIQYFLFV